MTHLESTDKIYTEIFIGGIDKNDPILMLETVGEWMDELEKREKDLLS